MADRNAQPTSNSAPDAAFPIPKKESKDEPQYEQTRADSSQNDTSNVRNSVLEAVANYQKKRISELERNLEKKRATIQRLSAAPSLPHSAFPIIPPTAMPAMPAVPTSAPNQSAPSNSPPPNPIPSSEGESANRPSPSNSVPPNSQAQPTTSTAASKPVMAPPMLGFHPQPHLPPYPYMFPPPDPSFAAQYMGVMSPTVLHPAQAAHAQPSGQVRQQDKGNDGQEQKQSRYWTADEHERFLAGMKACGPKNYMQISEYVGTRNAKQVRTHAQKYQKRLEREDAKRRSDMRHGRINDSGPMTSVEADAAAAVKAAAAAAMRGKVPGISSTPGKDSDSTGTPAGPSSSSSGKQCHSSHQHSQDASSADGSISANTAAEHHAETSGANNHSAAVAAIAAEAKALGRGALPPGAMKIPSHSFGNAPRPTMVNKNTGNVENENAAQARGLSRVIQSVVKLESSQNSAVPVQKSGDIEESNKDGDEAQEPVELCRAKCDELLTAGDSNSNTTRKECTETVILRDNNQHGVEHNAGTNDELHMRKVKDIQVKTEDTIKDRSELWRDEQLSQTTKPGKEQGVTVRDDSVVHTRLTKAVSGHGSTQIVASRAVDSSPTVKHEPECVDSGSNLTEGKATTVACDAVAGEKNGSECERKMSSFGLGEGQGREAERKDIPVKQETHMAVGRETESNCAHRNGTHEAGAEKAEGESGDGGKQSVGGEAHEESHGAGDQSNRGDGREECAQTKQASTAFDVSGKRGESAAEGRKRARDEEETGANKRARKEEGRERKESAATDAVGGAGRRSQPSGGNSTAAL